MLLPGRLKLQAAGKSGEWQKFKTGTPEPGL
jgi:hypothetical protein